MALTLGDNFSYQGAKPLDARLKYNTLADMKAVADATMYDGCMAYCVATDKTYQWKSTNSVDASTGRWREFSSGGGSSVVVRPTLSSGTKIAEIDVDGTTSNLFAPEGGSGGTSDYEDLENKPTINNVTLEGNLTSGDLQLQDVMQVLTLPTPESALANKVYQYLGATTSSLTHGNFYECKLEGSSYAWIRIDVQPSGGGSSATVMSQTLMTGGVSVTFTGIPTSGNYLVDFYTSTGINYTGIDFNTPGQVTLTFDQQQNDVVVYCEVKEVSV